MEDHEKLREIQEWGEKEELFPEETSSESRGSWIPLLQTGICVGVLILLLALRAWDSPSYQAFAEWFQDKSTQEFSLPAWEGIREDSSPAPSPSPSPSPSSMGEKQDVSLQRL